MFTTNIINYFFFFDKAGLHSVLFFENSAKICRIAKNERFTSVSPQ